MKSTSIYLVYVILLIVANFKGMPVVSAQQVKLDWASHFPGSGNDEGLGIVVDEQGNVYTVGVHTAWLDMDPGMDTLVFLPKGSPSLRDVWIHKSDPTGKLVWARQIGGAGSDYGFGIDLDEKGNVYVTGFFAGIADLNPSADDSFKVTAAGQMDIYILKLNNDGQFVWAKTMGADMTDQGLAITAGKKGKAKGFVYVTGFFSGKVDFNPDPSQADSLSAAGGRFDNDIFVLKLDTGGNYIWAKSMGGTGTDQGMAIAVDSLGNVYTTGRFSGTADFDPGSGASTLVSKGSNDIFISKLDESGWYVWARQIGGKADDQGKGIKVDNMGNVYTTGYFNDTVDFNPGTGVQILAAVPSFWSLYVNKLDKNGEYVWAKSISGNNFIAGYGIALDGKDGVYVTGSFWSGTTFDFDPGTGSFVMTAHPPSTTTFDNPDVFILKLDLSGNFAWANSFGGPVAENGNAIYVDDAKNIYTTGSFQDKADFDPDTGSLFYSALSGNDVFVQKLGCAAVSFAEMQVETDCLGYLFYDHLYTETGVYEQVLSNAVGCDSILTLNLIVNTDLQVHITVKGFELGVSSSYATYQWLMNEEIIPGATGPIYLVSENADYRVAITNENGCADTSDVYRISNVAVEKVNVPLPVIRIYPNPVQTKIQVQSLREVNLALFSIEGKKIAAAYRTKEISVRQLSPGIYLLHITDEQGRLIKVEKIVKQ